MTISNQSAGWRPGVCLSTNRPTSPYNGQVIYETDTGKTLVWNSTTWAYLSTGSTNPLGLELMIPLNVSGTGVSVSGAVTTFSAASTGFINGVFSSAYRNYLIIWDTTTNVGGGYLRWRRSAGGSVLGGAYTTVGTVSGVSGGTGSTTSISSQQAVTYGIAGSFGVASSVGGGRFQIFQPAITGLCTLTFESSCYSANSANDFTSGGSMHYTAGTADGLEISTSGTSWTGTMTVYGFRRSI